MSGPRVTLEVDGVSGAPDLESFMAAKLADAFRIFKERQAKYGSGNIARRGPVGVLVRLDDKLARLDRVFMEGRGEAAADESVEDTCLDIANYALILLACHAGRWPGWTTKPAEGTGPAYSPGGILSGDCGRLAAYVGPPLYPATPEQDSLAAEAARDEKMWRESRDGYWRWTNTSNVPEK